MSGGTTAGNIAMATVAYFAGAFVGFTISAGDLPPKVYHLSWGK